MHERSSVQKNNLVGVHFVNLGEVILRLLQRGVVAGIKGGKGADESLGTEKVLTKGLCPVLVGEVMFCLIDESCCPEDDVSVAVLYDMFDGEAVAAWASGVIPSEGPESVRVVGIETMPGDDSKSRAL